METRANFVLLGAVTIIGAALVMIFVAWLIGSDWRGGFNHYDVVFQGPVRGLAAGGEVRFNGIKVGEVKTLNIDPEDPTRVIARIRVNAKTPVREDSRARLEAMGLTGVTLIQLDAGSPDKPLLRPRLGQPPPRIYAVPGMIEGLLSEENLERIIATLRNLEKITADLARPDSVVGESARTARDLAAAARSVAKLSEETRGSVRGLTTRADQTLADAQRAVAHADLAVVEFQRAASEASDETLPEVTEAARDLRRLSRAMERLAGEIEENPSSLISGRGPQPTIQVPQ
jgi:phospholipid/cholesterol/gamma-HCH transport system substrate-binding protein